MITCDYYYYNTGQYCGTKYNIRFYVDNNSNSLTCRCFHHNPTMRFKGRPSHQVFNTYEEAMLVVTKRCL